MLSSVSLRRFLPFLVIFALFFLPTIDTDLGWHLRSGEYFLKTGKFLRENTLTYFLPNYQWQYSPIYQVLTTLIFRLGGLFMLSFGYAFLATITFFIFTKTNARTPYSNFITFLLISLTSWNVFHLGWRAQVFSFTGLVCTFYLLKKSETAPKILYLVPLLFFIWANLHGAFVLGFPILAFSTIQAGTSKNWKRASMMASIIAASVITTLVNPSTFGVYKEALQHAQYPLGNLIAEWVAPPIPAKALILVAANIVVFFLLTQKPKQKIFWLLVIISATALALQARRNYPIFALASVLALIDIFKDRLEVIENYKIVQKSFFVLSGVALTTLIILNFPKTTRIDTNWKSYCTESVRVLPCRAVEYIRAYPPKGENVYTAYEWGGFLEWQLPYYKYFVDGRMPTWPTPENESPYTIYLELIQAQPGYQERLDEYGTDWLFIGNGTFLDIELTNNKTSPWQEVYRDKVAVLYTKK